MRTFHVPVLMALTAALILPTAAPAATVLYEQEGPGGAWAAIRVASTGDAYELDVWGCGPYTKLSSAVKTFDENGDQIGSSTTAGVRSADGAWLASTTLDIEHGSVARAPSAAHGCSGLGKRFVGGGPIERTYLLWTTGDIQRHHITLEAAGPGVTVEAVERGERAYLHTSEDFRGAANAIAGTGGGTLRGQALTGIPFDVEHELFGAFTFGIVGGNALTAVTPQGATACPCFWDREPSTIDVDDQTLQRGSGPGHYEFQMTGAGVHAGFTGEVFLTLVDAKLPE